MATRTGLEAMTAPPEPTPHSTDWQDVIRREEIYRDEVRRALERSPPPTRRGRAWAFLNSSLGLWLLSAVGLTGLTSAYTAIEGRVTAAQAQAQQVARLDLEIEWRLSQFLSQLRDLSAPDSRSPVRLAPDHSMDEVRAAWANLVSCPDTTCSAARSSGVHPEMERRNLLSLLVELQKLSPEGRETIRRAAVAIATGEVVGNDLESTIQSFHRLLLIPRWRTVAPYVDCQADEPFC